MWKRFSQSQSLRLTSGNVLASALGFINFYIVAKVLSVNEFGSWVLFLSTAGLVEMIRTGIIRQGFVRAYHTASDATEKRTVLGAAWLLNLSVSAAIPLVALFGTWLLKDWVTAQNLTYYLIFVPTFMLVSIPHAMGMWIAQVREDFLKITAYKVLLNSSLLVVLLVLRMTGAATLSELTTIYVCLVGFVGMILSFPHLQLSAMLFATKTQVRELWRFGTHNVATLTGATFLKSTDLLMIGAFLGAPAVALYSLPLKILEVVDIPFRSVIMVKYSQLCQLAKVGGSQRFKAAAELLLATTVALALAAGIMLSIGADVIVKIMDWQEPASAALLIRIFCVALLLMAIDKVMGVLFDSIGRPKENARKVWLMLLVNVLGNWLVLHLTGSLYAVAAVTSLNLVAGVLYSIKRFKYARISPTNVLLTMQREAIKMSGSKSWQAKLESIQQNR